MSRFGGGSGGGRSRVLALVLVLAAAAILWVALGAAVPTAGDRGASNPAVPPAIADVGRPRSEATPNAARSPAREDEPVARDRARRDALRDRILEAVAEQQSRDRSAAVDASTPEPPRGKATAQAPGLRDRIGGRDALRTALGDDWMPLARECIDHAVERDPTLVGMLAIEVEVVGDVELGSVIESVDFPADRNEVSDAELLRCVRETTLSAILPAPDEGGSEAFLLTLPVEPPEPR